MSWVLAYRPYFAFPTFWSRRFHDSVLTSRHYLSHSPRRIHRHHDPSPHVSLLLLTRRDNVKSLIAPGCAR